MRQDEEQDTRETEALAADETPPAETPLGESPAEADRDAAERAPEPPLGEMAGAFVGAFAAAKLLKRLGRGD